MNRIDTVIVQSDTHKILSPYITAGDPDMATSLSLMHTLVEAGADILEVGIPFSDPMAEGPVIQAAMERALQHDIWIDDVLSLIASFRKKNHYTPIILMGYVNPIEMYGYDTFASNAQEAGVDGIILVDMPPEESAEAQKIWDAHNIYQIFLCSPTTTDERMALINTYGRGYLYYVSLKGVTGSATIQNKDVQEGYQHRKAQTHLPMLVGFGIKTPETAARIATFSSGVIVGAALVEAVYNAHQNNSNMNDAAFALIHAMRTSIDESR